MAGQEVERPIGVVVLDRSHRLDQQAPRQRRPVAGPRRQLGLLGRQSCGAVDLPPLEQDRGLVPEHDGEGVEISHPPRHRLLLGVAGEGAVEISAGARDRGDVADRLSHENRIAELAGQGLLLGELRQRTVEVAAVEHRGPLVGDAGLEAGAVAEHPAEQLLLTHEVERLRTITLGPPRGALVAEADLEHVAISGGPTQLLLLGEGGEGVVDLMLLEERGAEVGQPGRQGGGVGAGPGIGDDGSVKGERGSGVSAVGEQTGDGPRQVGGRRRIRDHRGVDLVHPMGGHRLEPGPVCLQVEQVGPVGHLEMRRAGERARQLIPVAGLGLLPRELVDDARGDGSRSEVGGEAAVRPGGGTSGAEVPVVDRAAHIGVSQHDPARPEGERGAGGQEQWGIGTAGQRLARGRAEQVEQFRLGQPTPAGGHQGERVGHQPRPVAFVVLLVPGEHELEEIVDRGGGQVVLDAGAEREVVAVLAQLVEHDSQEPRIRRPLGGGEAVLVDRVQGLGVLPEELAGQLAAGRTVEEIQVVLAEASPATLVERPPRECREHEAEPGRKAGGQPRQLEGALAIVELIEAVEDEHDPLSRRRLIECRRERHPQLVTAVGDDESEPHSSIEYAHHSAGHGGPVAARPGGTDVMDDHRHARPRRIGAQSVGPGRDQS